MLSTPKIVKKNSGSFVNESGAELYSELQFISEFVQDVSAESDLRHTVRKTAELLLEITDAEVCAAVAQAGIGELIDSCQSRDKNEKVIFDETIVSEWLNSNPPTTPFSQPSQWLKKGAHISEVVTPLVTGG